MTNNDILNIAMQQSAIDSNCDMDDFKSFENKVVISRDNQNARKYLELPFLCDLTSYGNNIVASVSEELSTIVTDYINKYPVEHCFETPNLHVLIEKLKPFNMSVCFMAEYFLPDMTVIKPLECNYETKILEAVDFVDLYLPEWSNALCENRKDLDKLAVGAYHNGKLIGLAGCSADCDSMWQIGIDVLPAYRRQGIASCLTNKLALEVLSRNIVPFYCCAWSNIKSARNAIKSGFKPAWVQVTVKTNEFITNINR
ncbi:GNAT family N-acetyltransferase [Clostridium sp.]|uniref:GNAT family N-acetyltransferase n=1 Tax=Clostridium sp. TaxID=1506 RepID=UPI0028475D2D|nr:GNAT family N-acetyltransferase [Clostridium sp.]MDR3595631.1 GNAT family N-acetyltransferase [Clostridium sp.]